MATWLKDALGCEELGIIVHFEIGVGSLDVHVSVELVKDLSPGETLVIPWDSSWHGQKMIEEAWWLARRAERTVTELRHQAYLLEIVGDREVEGGDLWGYMYDKFNEDCYRDTLWLLQGKGLIENVPGTTNLWRRVPEQKEK